VAAPRPVESRRGTARVARIPSPRRERWLRVRVDLVAAVKFRGQRHAHPRRRT
jgi:hypothetical protein